MHIVFLCSFKIVVKENLPEFFKGRISLVNEKAILLKLPGYFNFPEKFCTINY